MKRLLIVATLLLAVSASTVVFAAPVGQGQQPVIVQPEQNAVVSGVVQVVGSATHSEFQRYELYYAPAPVPSDSAWIFVGADAHYQPQPLGLLATWDSQAVPDGNYGLRVRVVKQDGNYLDSAPVTVRVANTAPAATDTPETTPTATPTPEAGAATTTGPEATAPPVPTVVVDLSAIATSVAESAPAPTEADGAEAASDVPAPGAAGEEEAAAAGVEVSRLARRASQAGLYTIGLFALVGILFGVRAAALWFWNRSRP